MEESKIVLSLLLPADKNTAKAVHPAMGAFDDPAAGAFVRILCEITRFLIAGANMSGKTKLSQERTHLIVVVALVQTHALWLISRWFRSGNDDAIQSGLHQFHIMAVGTFNCQAQRHTLTVSQQRPFRSLLRAIRWIVSGFFPHPVALWSSPRPYSTMST